MCQELWTLIQGFHSSTWRDLASSKSYDFHIWSIIKQYLEPLHWKINRFAILTVVDRVTHQKNPDVLLCHQREHSTTSRSLSLYDFYGNLIRPVSLKHYNSGPFHTTHHYAVADTIHDEKIVLYSFASRIYGTSRLPHHMCIKVQIENDEKDEEEKSIQFINLLASRPDSQNLHKHYISGLYFDQDHQHLFAIESNDGGYHPIIHVLKRDPVTQLMVHTHILEYEQRDQFDIIPHDEQRIIESHVKQWNWHTKQFWFSVRHHQTWACFTISPVLLNQPIIYDAPKLIHIPKDNDPYRIVYYLYLPGIHFTGFDRFVEYQIYYNAGHSGTCFGFNPYSRPSWNHNILWKSEQDVEKVYLSSKGLLLAVRSRGYGFDCMDMYLYHLGPFSDSSSSLKVRHES